MKTYIFSTTFLIITIYLSSCNSDIKENTVKIQKNNYYETDYNLDLGTLKISGTLLMPDSLGQYPVVLIIAGSGPTDRNGNNCFGLKTDAYKMLADSLAKHNIASVRFDKRGIAKSYYSNFQESELLFDTYIQDTEKWIEKLKLDKQFTKVIVLGHSEGSLIGMISCKNVGCDAYISVAGPSVSADSLLISQLSKQSKIIVDESAKIIKSLKSGKKTAVLNSDLMSLFRLSVQPYLISWFQYVPTVEIAKLEMPCLIIQGNTDIQIDYHNSEELQKANPKAELKIIDGMNHILKDAPADTLKNSLTYTNASLELSKEFCKEIIAFLDKIK